MLKLARRARGHFVTLIEIRVHLIRVKPGHISKSKKKFVAFDVELTVIVHNLLFSLRMGSQISCAKFNPKISLVVFLKKVVFCAPSRQKTQTKT